MTLDEVCKTVLELDDTIKRLDKIEAWLKETRIRLEAQIEDELQDSFVHEDGEKLLALVRVYREANQLIANTELESGTLRPGDVIRFEHSFWKVQLQARAAEGKAKEIVEAMRKKMTFDHVIEELIREFERHNFKHVNDCSETDGFSFKYNNYVVLVAKACQRMKEALERMADKNFECTKRCEHVSKAALADIEEMFGDGK